MNSKLNKIGNVIFPDFTGEMAYMVEIQKNKPLPDKYSRWSETINLMLKGIEVDSPLFMTIHQSIVKKGESQRRGGVHIDGNWIESKYKTMAWDAGPSWKTNELEKGGIILASDCVGTKAYTGKFEGEPEEGGDCSLLNLNDANALILEPNTAYIGNVTMVHESMPSPITQKRIFVRLTMPEDFIFAA